MITPEYIRDEIDTTKYIPFSLFRMGKSTCHALYGSFCGTVTYLFVAYSRHIDCTLWTYVFHTPYHTYGGVLIISIHRIPRTMGFVGIIKQRWRHFIIDVSAHFYELHICLGSLFEPLPYFKKKMQHVFKQMIDSFISVSILVSNNILITTFKLHFVS